MVACRHELGHAIGLADGAAHNPLNAIPNGSVMNESRGRGRTDVPTHFDLHSVRMIYE